MKAEQGLERMAAQVAALTQERDELKDALDVQIDLWMKDGYKLAASREREAKLRAALKYPEDYPRFDARLEEEREKVCALDCLNDYMRERIRSVLKYRASSRRNQTVEGTSMKPVAYMWKTHSGEVKFAETTSWDCWTPLYTADQLREAQVKVLREAGRQLILKSVGATNIPMLTGSVKDYLDRMADELEKQT
jgi:hypothetical protein